MGKIILISVLFLLSNTIIKSQNKIAPNIGFGYYIINSENSTKIMEDKKFHSYIFYGLSYERDDFFGYNFVFEYSYQQTTKENILKFERYDPSPNPSPPPFWGDIKLLNHNFDLDYKSKINNYFSYGLGPSFIITNRILEVDTVLFDKLASSGLGVNGFLEYSLQLNENTDYFFFTSKLKLRYTHSIWFDEGIRNLENYDQEYFTVQLLIGIGYSF